MKLVSIVGARPQFIKIAPLARSFQRYNAMGDEPVENVIVHTGQHYDLEMSDIFFEELQIPAASFNLGIGSGSHGRQTGLMLEGIEKILLQLNPDAVLIYGDTNSTVAGALAAAKLHIPVAHVEAGVRSFNRRMPEEVNRVVSDHASDLLLAPTSTAIENLNREGLGDKAVLTGDVMFDSVLLGREVAERRSTILQRHELSSGEYGVVTIHRAENTEDEERLSNLLAALNETAAESFPLILPVHPRLSSILRSSFSRWSPHPRLRLIDPIGYFDMLCLVSHARVTLTDSGGLQKEAFFLGCPCITLRDETEWVETVEAGWNTLAGTEPARVREAATEWLTHRRNGNGAGPAADSKQAFGDGSAAEKIRDVVIDFIRRRRRGGTQ
jgi:UDP-GlcNAc3NAcA epimerase